MSTPYEKLLIKSALANHPIFATLELTFKCNMACKFCYNPVERKGQDRTNPLTPAEEPDMTREELFSVLDQIQDMNVLFLTLTGGEALLHPDFWDLAFEAKRRGFALRIFSNGALITEAIADRLAELSPYCLEISVHGASEETAVKLNQVPGSHGRLLKALGYLKERDLRVFLKCVVTRFTENDLAAIRAIGDRFGYEVYFDPNVVVSDDGDAFPLAYRATEEGIRKLYTDPAIKMGNSPFERKPSHIACGTGSGTFSIDPKGFLYPCIQWKNMPLGNLKRQSLRDLWENSPFIQKARKAARMTNTLIRRETDAHAFCTHCPALSDIKHGDPNTLDVEHIRVAEIRKNLADEMVKETESSQT